MNAKPKILIVDDRPENLKALRKVLKDLDIELVEATSGNDALKATLHHDFTLALLDIQMPEMDGYELAGLLREEEKTAHLPFIFISAVYTDNLNVFTGYEKGAFSFITKPFQPEILINKVKFFIDKHHQEIALFELNRELKQNITEITNFKSLFESAPGCFLILFPDFTIDAVSDEYLKATMTKREEILGRHLFEVFPDNPDDTSADGENNLRTSLNLVLKNKETHRMAIQKYDIRNSDGTFVVRYWSPLNKPVLNNKGEVVYLIHSVEDITVRLKQEQELKDSFKEISDYKYALDESAIVSITDQKGIIKHANGNFCKISKYKQEELVGKDHGIVNSGFHTKEFIRDLWSTIAKGGLWKGELKNMAKDGSYYWVDTAIIPFLNEKGKPFQYISIRFDISEKKKQQDLLEAQSEELKIQQEELLETNAELEAQTQKLQASEEELIVQQEELMQSNHELEEKNHLIIEKNEELEAASIELYRKAEELALSSKYKSEFLANMSHELRTPLNSILLLSKLMADNMESNLTKEQIEFSSVIYNSGNSLLELINEILDLSKIESGKMEIDIENVELKDIFKSINDTFTSLAKEKKISFSIKKENELLSILKTDKIRVEQVLKNFLSNAFKFTEKGSIELIVRLPNTKESEKMKVDPLNYICFEVKDSGIGIPKEKHAMVFEAFQQADGSTRRKYGGTGLGLSISREIAHLLGGEIYLESESGKGSSFSLVIPIEHVNIETIFDKNEKKEREKETQPLDFSEKSVDQNEMKKHLRRKEKTVSNVPKKILLVDDNQIHTQTISRFLGTPQKVFISVETAKEAYEILSKERIDCLVLDIGLPDETGYKVLETVKKNKKFEKLPVIIYTGMSISLQEEKKLKQYANAIILKTADSFKRLSGELSLLLKIVDGKEEEKTLKKPYLKDEILVYKHVLVVDDDIRNIYSITKILESQKMKVTSASDGNEALTILNANKDIDIILMDMMMPNKDGYETTIEIRNNQDFKKIPVIALTAKAMLGDREKCMNAGANDYVTKPVDADQLLALLRVWLYK